MDVNLLPPDAEIRTLSDALILEIVNAIGLPKTEQMGRLFRPIFHKPADRLAAIGATADRMIATDGFPAAATWMLTNWCSRVTARGTGTIPPAGPLLVVSNHAGSYDTFVIASQLGREDMKLISSDVPFLKNLPNANDHIIFLLIGIVMWVAMLKSGIHATLTGVIVAMFIPLRAKNEPKNSPLKDLEHDLHPMVAYLVLPIFAFANAGISLKNIGLEQIFHSVPIGIALGLFLGKQFGIFGMSWLFIKLKLTSLPSGLTWSSLYGTAVL